MIGLSPAVMLGVLVALTLLAWALAAVSRRRRRRALRRLAAEWRMNYSAHDRLRLGPRVAARFPVAGAADVFVFDVIYAAEGSRYRYIFTAEYTSGIVKGKRRISRVAGFTESRDRQSPELPDPVSLAPEGLPLIEQYRRLAPRVQPATPERGG